MALEVFVHDGTRRLTQAGDSLPLPCMNSANERSSNDETVVSTESVFCIIIEHNHNI